MSRKQHFGFAKLYHFVVQLNHSVISIFEESVHVEIVRSIQMKHGIFHDE